MPGETYMNRNQLKVDFGLGTTNILFQLTFKLNVSRIDNATAQETLVSFLLGCVSLGPHELSPMLCHVVFYLHLTGTVISL